jgi:hypothetical protein
METSMSDTPDTQAAGLLSAERLAELKKLAEAATPGPWETDGWSSVLTVEKTVPVYNFSKPIGPGKYPLTHYESARIAHLNDGEYIENPNSQADAAYLAALSPEVVLALLAHVEAARALGLTL